MAEQTKSYQDLKAKLNAIMQELQSEDTDIDTAVELYEQGQIVLKQLDKYLKEVAQKTENPESK